MRRVLVVAYYTPPLGLSGVMRVTKLCKYLPEAGWSPLILTVKPSAYYHYDAALLDDLRESCIYRTESLDPARLLNRLRPRKSRQRPALGRSPGRWPRLLNHVLLPDSKIGWFPFASIAGRHILHREKPAAIFATGPPFTALLLGVQLKAHSRVPLVADFRDPWPTGFAPPPRYQRPALRALREYVVRHADAVLAVNQGTALQVGPKAQVIDNGYDPADFEVETRGSGSFDIVHVGNLWQNESEIVDVAEGLRRVPGVRLHLVGRMDSQTRARLEPNPQVLCSGPLAHVEVCRLMKGAGALLYVGKPGQPVGLKLYEYFGARRPIIVWGDEKEEAAQLVEECRAGLTCHTAEGFGQAVESARDREADFAASSRSRFNRREQARRLAALLASLI